MNKKTVYLVGFMGTGKTTVGQRLAKREGLPFVDLDDYLVEQKGMKISDIFNKFGEKTFRLWEQEALLACSKTEAVIATGGGIVENSQNMEIMLTTGRVVYLQTSFEIIYSRIKGDSNRPLTTEGKEALRNRYLKRKPLYEKAAITIDTNKKTAEEIALELQTFLFV